MVITAGTPLPPGDSKLLPTLDLCPQVRERCLGLCVWEEEGQPPGASSGDSGLKLPGSLLPDKETVAWKWGQECG